MPKYLVYYYHLRGPNHHHPDYMDPDAPLERVDEVGEIEAKNEEEAREKFQKEKRYATITRIERQ